MKHVFFFIVLSCGVAINTWSQDYQVIDSLRDIAVGAKGDKFNEIQLQLAWEYRKSHPDSTLYYCQQVVELVKKDPRDPYYAKALNFMGVAYHYKGDDVNAFNYYDRALDLGQKSDSIQMGHALNNLGRFYMEQGDYVSSYENYRRALQIFSKKNDQSSVSYAYKSMAELYITQERFDKALEMTNRTLALRRKSGDLRGQISVLNEVAGIYLLLNDYESAFKTYEEAMVISTKLQDKVMISRIHLGISKLHFVNNDFTKALQELKKAKIIADANLNQSLDNDINLQLGKIYYELGDFEKSETSLNELLKEGEQSQDLNLEREASFYLAQMYRRSGRYEQAFDKFQRHHELVSILENSANARLIERLEARIEIESTGRENELLLAQQEIDLAIKSRLRMQNILLTGGTLMAFAIVLILYLMYKKRMEVNRKLIEKSNHIADQREEISKHSDQIAKQNNILTAHNAELATLNSEKDTLMNILAHDLKAPFNRIRGLAHLFELTDLTGEQLKYLGMLQGAAGDGLNLIRDLLEVSALSGHERQPDIKRVSIKSELELKRDTFKTEAESKHINIDVEIEDDLVIDSDPSYISRILDNLISNAIKFSSSGSNIILSGGINDGRAYFSVKDFGPGFRDEDRGQLYNKFSKLSAQPTAGESSNGLGLAIVKILVDSLQGEIELVSAPGQGSEFIISFPDNKKIYQSN